MLTHWEITRSDEHKLRDILPALAKEALEADFDEEEVEEEEEQ